MRARLALSAVGYNVKIREIDLREKAPLFLETSPKGTVPVLVLPDGTILDESLDIVDFACQLPQGETLRLNEASQDQYDHLLNVFNDGALSAIYHYKYPERYPEINTQHALAILLSFLKNLDDALGDQLCLASNTPTKADIVFLPFIRQLEMIDAQWFASQTIPRVHGWLRRFIESDSFSLIMCKYAYWSEGDQEPLLL